jgi:hypothetical protein
MMMVANLYEATVLTEVTNGKWQAQAQRGTDTIHIPKRPTITIRNYEIGLPLEVERPSAGRVTLNIDKGLYFATILDNVLEIQSKPDLMEIWTQEAAWAMKVALDQAVLSTIHVAAHANNVGNTAGKVSGIYKLGAAGSPLVVVSQGQTIPTNGTDVMSLITDLGCVLDEQNVPPEDRWLIVPSWLAGRLKKSDHFRSAEKMGDDKSAFRSGLIGTVEGMKVYISHLLPTALENSKKCYYVLCGQIEAVTFASQLNRIVRTDVERSMAELLKGLYTYGSLVVDPKRVAAAYVTPAPIT